MNQKADMEEQQAVTTAATDISAVLARFDQLDSELCSEIEQMTSQLSRRITLQVTLPLYLVLVAGIVALAVNAF